jgi:uncharacterized OB-fold protein
MLTVESFYDNARRGKLMGLVCPSGHLTVPPKNNCRVCSSSTLELKQLSGKGKILSFTEVFVKSKEFPVETPYILALVQLDEGGKLLGVLTQNPSSKTVDGASVQVEFKKIIPQDKWPRIFFRLEE